MNPISIMQGRLSQPSGNRLQFFPEKWAEEFSLAQNLGFNSIQWFLDRDIEGFEPIRDIWQDEKILNQIDRVRKTIPISSIDCGKYKMFGIEAKGTLEYFGNFLPTIRSRLSTGIISVPLLEENAPKTDLEKGEVRNILQKINTQAESMGIRIALETEMSASELLKYTDSFKSGNIGVCYDIGNCTSYGFDCSKDIILLDKRIFEVHLKDRKIGMTQSLLLGTGDAKFDSCIESLKEIGYLGSYTLQAWRGQDYMSDAKIQLQFIRQKINKINE